MKTQLFISAFTTVMMLGTSPYNDTGDEREMKQNDRNCPPSDSITCPFSAPAEAFITVSCTQTANGVLVTGHLRESRTFKPIAGTIKVTAEQTISTTPEGWFGFTGRQWSWVFFFAEGYQPTGQQIVTSESAYWIVLLNKY